MNIDRRQLALPALALGLLSIVPAAFAASADEANLAKTLEAFRQAQLAKDAKTLTSLCADELSYSHSDARVEDKATFVKNSTDNRFKMIKIEYLEPSIKVVGSSAIVRFHWIGEAEAVADGKKALSNIHVLMNWQKRGSKWVLLSRGATKLG